MTSNRPYHSWAFTLFDERAKPGVALEACVPFFQEWLTTLDLTKFNNLSAAVEAGENGHPHVQGCFKIGAPKRMGGAKRLLDPTGRWQPHLKPQVEDYETNRKYVLKDVSGSSEHPKARKGAPEMWRQLVDKIATRGRPASGTTTTTESDEDIGGTYGSRSREREWDKFATKILAGAPARETVMKHTRPGFACQNLEKLLKFASYVAPERDFWASGTGPRVAFFFGKTGCGKTLAAQHLARLLSPNQKPYPVMPQDTLKWFEGYEQQDVVRS